MVKRITTSDIQRKKGKEAISCLTAYDAMTASWVEAAGCDIVLVGDSMGNVVLGYDSTIPVTMEAMIHHTGSVARGCRTPLVVADMPFMSYQAGVDEALRNAGRLIKEAGAQAVKLEGGKRNKAVIERMVATGIPVMGHIGVTPQSVHGLPHFGKQGKCDSDKDFLIKEASLLESAGAFAVVLENVDEDVAKLITEKVSIPTIGIGSGDHCDGQVLVTQDLLGMSSFIPPFVQPKLKLRDSIIDTLSAYVQGVRSHDVSN